MSAVISNERKRIHPHKFTLWVAMGSIVMMFAGLTSAYIVRKSAANWLEFQLPAVFWASTLVILFSSVTIHLALKSFKARKMQRYRALITLTAILGILFAVLQYFGFSYLLSHGVKIFGTGSNPSASFLGVIVGLHALHVLGGVVALLVIFLRAYSLRTKNYNATAIEIVSTYWHFVDILWIYLFIFLKWF
ncbi:cytochrome c oxidase subunit 3 [Parafilimonas sp.]|uniref:cytochrome c oxidase subunit 3 n=1 Tax=Parafilimonas sp. TaxID=1969739 RepID=UPI0039E3F67C